MRFVRSVGRFVAEEYSALLSQEGRLRLRVYYPGFEALNLNVTMHKILSQADHRLTPPATLITSVDSEVGSYDDVYCYSLPAVILLMRPSFSVRSELAK